MRSVTSFFNFQVLRKHITRFLPVWTLYLLGCLMILPGIISAYQPSMALEDLDTLVNLMAYWNLAYGLICGEMLFGDLFNSRLCNAIHAMPLRREGWFLTGTVAGCGFSFVPNLVLALCFLPRLEWYGKMAFLWMLAVDLEFLFFFGMAVFCMLCVGNRFAGALLYGLLNVIPLLAGWLVESLYLPLLSGVVMDWDVFHRMTPISWFGTNSGFLGSFQTNVEPGYLWTHLGILSGLGILMLGAALWIYRKRKLECAGDFAAVPGLKPIFLVVFTLSCGAVFHLFSQWFLNGHLRFLFLTVGILVGYLSGNMLVKRTVRVFHLKTCGGLVIMAAVLLATMGLTALDPLGVTRWVPDEETVVALQMTMKSDLGFSGNSAKLTGEDISGGIALHNRMLESQTTESGEDVEVYLTYTLTNGRKVQRNYRVNVDSSEGEFLRQQFSKPETVLGYQDWDSWLNRIVEVEIENTFFSGEDARELLEAIKRDCENGNMVQNTLFHEETNGETRCYLWCVLEQSQMDYNMTDYCYLTIYPDAEETMRWLNQRDIQYED